MTWIRLRQIALVAHDLDAVVGELHDVFGLEVAFRDPAVGSFGLVNAVLPCGNQFIEVVSPTRDGTAGGRQLERLGGDGGYMVICHTDDHDAVTERVAAHGVRTVIDMVDEHMGGYHIMQLHPADTGGSFLEIDFQPGGEDITGPWGPAGPDWQSAKRTEIVSGISAVVVASRDPGATAARWSAITGCDLDDGVLALDNATVTFVDGPVEALVAAALVASDPGRAGERHVVAGVEFTLR
jgi:hypothetical protein